MGVLTSNFSEYSLMRSSSLRKCESSTILQKLLKIHDSGSRVRESLLCYGIQGTTTSIAAPTRVVSGGGALRGVPAEGVAAHGVAARGRPSP